MHTLEIHATCQSAQGRSEILTHTIESNQQAGNLSPKEHHNILRALLALLSRARALFPDADAPADESKTELVYWQWELRFVDASGTPQTIGEDDYFQQIAPYQELTPLILDYCRHTDHGAYNSRLWTDDELPAGTYAILPLVYQDRAAIDHYIEFLRTNDLEHEVDQAGDIEEIITHHGWCRETARLAIARVITCCGQHGHEQFSEFLEGELSEYLEDPAARAAFLEDIQAEIRVWARMDHHPSLRETAREQYLELLRFWTEPFEEVLTDAELAGIWQAS